MKEYKILASREKSKKADFSMTWWPSEFPLLYEKWRILVDKQRKSHKNKTRGEFRALLLGLAEKGLLNKSPIKTPIERVEQKLDEVLHLMRQGIPIPTLIDEVQEHNASENKLSDEERLRLNQILSL